MPEAEQPSTKAEEGPAAGRRRPAGGRGANGARPGSEGDLSRVPLPASSMDDLNWAIVELLQHDGRMPFNDIAKRLQVSEGTVRNRVNWMKRAGMLRIVAIADPMSVNYKADAMLGIKVGPNTTPRRLAERLAPNPEVVYVLWVSGRFDLLVEIVCDDDQRLNRFLEGQVYGADDIASVEVMAGLEMFKNQFLLKRNLPLQAGAKQAPGRRALKRGSHRGKRDQDLPEQHGRGPAK